MGLNELKRLLLSDPEVKKGYDEINNEFEKAKTKIRKKRRLEKAEFN